MLLFVSELCSLVLLVPRDSGTDLFAIALALLDLLKSSLAICSCDLDVKLDLFAQCHRSLVRGNGEVGEPEDMPHAADVIFGLLYVCWVSAASAQIVVAVQEAETVVDLMVAVGSLAFHGA